MATPSRMRKRNVEDDLSIPLTPLSVASDDDEPSKLVGEEREKFISINLVDVTPTPTEASDDEPEGLCSPRSPTVAKPTFHLDTGAAVGKSIDRSARSNDPASKDAKDQKAAKAKKGATVALESLMIENARLKCQLRKAQLDLAKKAHVPTATATATATTSKVDDDTVMEDVDSAAPTPKVGEVAEDQIGDKIPKGSETSNAFRVADLEGQIVKYKVEIGQLKLKMAKMSCRELAWKLREEDFLNLRTDHKALKEKSDEVAKELNAERLAYFELSTKMEEREIEMKKLKIAVTTLYQKNQREQQTMANPPLPGASQPPPMDPMNFLKVFQKVREHSQSRGRSQGRDAWSSPPASQCPGQSSSETFDFQQSFDMMQKQFAQSQAYGPYADEFKTYFEQHQQQQHQQNLEERKKQRPTPCLNAAPQPPRPPQPPGLLPVPKKTGLAALVAVADKTSETEPTFGKPTKEGQDPFFKTRSKSPSSKRLSMPKAVAALSRKGVARVKKAPLPPVPPAAPAYPATTAMPKPAANIDALTLAKSVLEAANVQAKDPRSTSTADALRFIDDQFEQMRKDDAKMKAMLTSTTGNSPEKQEKKSYDMNAKSSDVDMEDGKMTNQKKVSDGDKTATGNKPAIGSRPRGKSVTSAHPATIINADPAMSTEIHSEQREVVPQKAKGAKAAVIAELGPVRVLAKAKAKTR